MGEALEATVSFPVSALGASVENSRETYEKLYVELTDKNDLKVDDVYGIQIIPSKWPRKVMVTVTSNDVKEKLLVEGLSLFDKHIDVHDESGLWKKSDCERCTCGMAREGY